MSLNQSIAHGKEHRVPYRGSKAIDRSCRNHGDCIWCLENRLYQARKWMEAMEDQLREYNEDPDTQEERNEENGSA